MKNFFKIFLLHFALHHSSVSYSQDRPTGKPWATRSEVIAQHGMVCTSHPLATQAGIDILKKGGNAIDAAIAANACLGLMEPNSCGVGGDLFVIVWDAKTQKLYGLNASGRSPKGLTRQYFKDKNLQTVPPYGPLPVTVPGCVDGWFELHKKFGRLKMSEILQPSIDYAMNGFPVTEVIAYNIHHGTELFINFPNYKETYTINGNELRKGDIFKNPGLANTYRLLATKGRDEFYKGTIAKTIVEFIKSQGGFLELSDFSAHQADWVDPVSTSYRGYDVWELPPNGQGISVLQMLNILEGYDIKKFGFGSPEHVHYFVEAKKLAYEDRAKYYADPQFSKVPVKQLISKEYAKKRRVLIKEDKAGEDYEAGELSDNNTIYLSVADKDGNMVSLIQSISRNMGSGMVPPGLGFMLHDRGELFSLADGHANVFEPGKRPFHTIIPAFITKEGKPFLSFGVMGGSFQPLGHVQIIMDIVDFGMNLQEAGDAPRIDHIGSSSPFNSVRGENGGMITLENGFSYELIRRLMEMGHQVGWGSGTYGGYQAIKVDLEKRIYYGASESRKDGCAMGY